jgi:hypothetical protein
MSIENTKLTLEVNSTHELNQYLNNGWVLILSYAHYHHDGQEPRFVVSWQQAGEPKYPELLDAWERHEMQKDTGSLV